MTVAYKINKGSDVYDKIWWIKFWSVEAFKKLEQSEIFNNVGLVVDDFSFLGAVPLVKPNSNAYSFFRESLLKNADKNGYYRFRKNPKDKKAKEFSDKFTEIILPFSQKKYSFIYLDVFGFGNFQGGMVNDEMAIVRCLDKVEKESKYLEFMELISESEFYRLKAEMVEK